MPRLILLAAALLGAAVGAALPLLRPTDQAASSACAVGGGRVRCVDQPFETVSLVAVAMTGLMGAVGLVALLVAAGFLVRAARG